MEKYLIELKSDNEVKYFRSPYSSVEESEKCAQRLRFACFYVTGRPVSYDVLSGSAHEDLWKKAKIIH